MHVICIEFSRGFQEACKRRKEKMAARRNCSELTKRRSNWVLPTHSLLEKVNVKSSVNQLKERNIRNQSWEPIRIRSVEISSRHAVNLTLIGTIPIFIG